MDLHGGFGKHVLVRALGERYMGLYRDSRHGESNAKMDNESETPPFMLWYHSLVLPFVFPSPINPYTQTSATCTCLGICLWKWKGFSVDKIRYPLQVGRSLKSWD